MILENNPDFSYAILLVADYHGEYPLQRPADILWDPHNIEYVSQAIGHDEPNAPDIDAITTRLFGDLPLRYNGSYDPNMMIWRIQGDRDSLHAVFNDLAQQLMGGPRGADDDTFDYWPNAFDMLYVLAQDLINLDDPYPRYILETVVRVIDSAIALTGPLSEWEADELDRDIINLTSLVKEKEGS